MINIAVVDDDKHYLFQVEEYIKTYSKETGEEFEVSLFNSSMDFLEDYKPVYDIVFLDIEMPLIDGMTAARKLRQIDDKVCLVFITKMAKYAIEGYEVNAIDFVIKPIKYFNFADKLKKAIRVVRSNADASVVVKMDENYRRIPVSKIYYILKDKNYLVYVTEQGELRERGTMVNLEKQLRPHGFSLCNSGCLVNLKAIQQMSPTDITVNDTTLTLSRLRIKEFKSDMLKFLRRSLK